MRDVFFSPITNDRAVCLGIAHHPGCKIHVPAEGVSVIDSYLAHVHTDPYSYGRMPRVGMKSDSEPHRCGSIVEQRQDSIASIFDQNPFQLTNEDHRTLKVLLSY